MSDVTDPNQGAEPETKSMQEMREAFEKQGKELAEERQRIANFERAEAFRSAGIPEGGEGSVSDLFRQSFKGELTPESIKEGWSKLGIPEAQPEPQVEGAPASTGEPEPAAQQPATDPVTAAAIADGRELRTSFSPGLTDPGADVLKAMRDAPSIDDIELIAREAGVPMVD